MTISELQILLDVNQGNEIAILEKHASSIAYDFGYFFVDSEDGICYLFDKNGKLDDIKKIDAIRKSCIKTDIKKIIIPDSVKRINEYAFWKCESLTSIEIPESVKSIGYDAFAFFCKSLTSIVFKGKTMDQVKAMDKYPWGIRDETIIRCS